MPVRQAILHFILCGAVAGNTEQQRTASLSVMVHALSSMPTASQLLQQVLSVGVDDCLHPPGDDQSEIPIVSDVPAKYVPPTEVCLCIYRRRLAVVKLFCGAQQATMAEQQAPLA